MIYLSCSWCSLLYTVVWCIIFLPTVKCVEEPEELVNLLAGSFTDGNHFSTGNTLPLISMPWGFNNWSPQTKEGSRRTGSWWFNGNDHELTWMRCTHQPSPWIGDWGWFLFTPQISHQPDRNPRHFWEPRGAVMKPHLFDAIVAPFGIRIELTPTTHGSIVRMTFPHANSNIYRENGDKRVCFTEAAWGQSGTLQQDGKQLHYLNGRATQVSKDRMPVTGFGLHIHITSETDDHLVTTVENHGELMCFKFTATGSGAPANIMDGRVVILRIATSLISVEQAMVSMRRELPVTTGFDDIALIAKRTWNKLLRRADVVNPTASLPGKLEVSNGYLSDITASRQLTVFYTALARSLLFPRFLDETTESGEVVHYSPYAPQGGVHKGLLVTDNGFWDTFRTVYPMLSIVYPDVLGDIIQGWLNAYKEGGWLPSWASPGYRNCMVGTFADVVVADAIVKGIKGFDYELAFRALHKDAYEAPPGHAGGAVGKDGLNDYLNFGYVPVESGGDSAVSRSLDFAFADFATANAFKKLAEMPQFSSSRTVLLKSASELSARALKTPEQLFDKSRGFMAPKDRSGNIRRVNEVQWGSGYTEGNAYHHSFIPWDIKQLVQLHNNGQTNFVPTGASVPGLRGGFGIFGSSSGGAAGSDTSESSIGESPNSNVLLQRLHALVTRSGAFNAGSYHQEIHEMREARAGAMGQYSHNNQPSHHLLYLFGLLNDRSSMEILLTQVMNRGYGPDFYAGDEDNGEMGAWFVLSALGLYDVNPGSANGEYVMGVPIFKHVRIDVVDSEAGVTATSLLSGSVIARAIDLERHSLHKDLGRIAPLTGRRTLDIVALGASPTMIHVQQVYLNGAKVESFSTTAANSGQLPANVVNYADLMGRGQQSSVLQFVMANEESNGPLVSKDSLDLFASGHEHVVATMTKRAQEVQPQQIKAPPSVVLKAPEPVSATPSAIDHDSRAVISNQELQIQQLQTQLASIRHHAIDAQQHHQHTLTKSPSQAPVAGDLPASTDGTTASVLQSLHKMINVYPIGLVLLIWLCGTLSLLCMITACTAYSYILMLSLCCGIRVVDGVDPKSYIPAAPVALCERIVRNCCCGCASGGLPFNTPKKAPVHTV